MALTTKYQLSNSAWTDLGVAPVLVQTLGGPARIVVADSAPSTTVADSYLLADHAIQLFYAADGSSHVYALSTGGTLASVAAIATVASAI